VVISEAKSYISNHYPYLPITVLINKQVGTVDAMLGTGFEGGLIIPEGLLAEETPPDSYLRFTLADPTAAVVAPSS
jgi:hypothetical protein